MKFIDLLRRLGILRFGAEGGVYRNATERPASFQMDDVFDSNKDVIDLDRRDKQGSPVEASTSSR